MFGVIGPVLVGNESHPSCWDDAPPRPSKANLQLCERVDDTRCRFRVWTEFGRPFGLRTHTTCFDADKLQVHRREVTKFFNIVTNCHFVPPFTQVDHIGAMASDDSITGQVKTTLQGAVAGWRKIQSEGAECAVCPVRARSTPAPLNSRHETWLVSGTPLRDVLGMARSQVNEGLAVAEVRSFPRRRPFADPFHAHHVDPPPYLSRRSYRRGDAACPSSRSSHSTLRPPPRSPPLARRTSSRRTRRSTRRPKRPTLSRARGKQVRVVTGAPASPSRTGALLSTDGARGAALEPHTLV